MVSGLSGQFSSGPGASTTVLDKKDSVETVATANVTLSGEQTINGVLTSTSRIGVVGQTAPAENGIYVTAAGAWTRAIDADEDAEITNGLAFKVAGAGSTKVGNTYILTTPDPITVGVTGLSFTEILPGVGLHGATHTDGSDDIQDATATQKGLATATQIAKLDGVEAGATADQAAEDIVSGVFDDARIAESNVTQHQGAIDHNALLNFLITQHRIINDAGSTTTELLSASKILDLVAAVSSGIDVKDPVETVADTNITLSGEQTINGVTTSASRIAVIGQTAGEDNGYYLTASGAWSRTTDADEDSEVTNGMATMVLNSSSTFFRHRIILSTADPITVGTTPLTFVNVPDIEFGTTAGTATEGNDSRVPSQDENDALVGTDGTPSSANEYVTDSDPRLAAAAAIVSGQFSDSTDQKPGVTTPVVITFNKNKFTPVGISHSETVNPEEFTINVSKKILWLAGFQWERTSGGADFDIDFFMQIDTGSGFVTVADSNVKKITRGVDSQVIFLGMNLEFNSGDKVRFMQRIEDTGEGMGIKATAIAGSVPATPSVILSVVSGT